MEQFCDAPMHDYQVMPAQWLLEHPRQKGLLIVVDTGAGKSRIAANAIMGLLQKSIVSNVLVIVPAKLQLNFHQALTECHAPKHKIHVLSAEKFSKNSPKMDETWCIVVDESHNFRNATTTKYKALHSACQKAGKVLLFTATPMKTRPDNLIAQLNLILDRQLPVSVMPDPSKLFAIIRHKVAFFTLQGTKFDTRPEVKTFKVLCGMSAEQERLIVEVLSDNHITTMGDLQTVMNQGADVEGEGEDSKEGTRERGAKGEGGARAREQVQKAMNSFFNKVRRFANSENAKTCSPKLMEMVKLLKHYKGAQAMVFSFWIAMGTKLATQCLLQEGFQNVAEVTGSLTQSKLKHTLADFDAKKINTLVFSSAASEGVSTKNVKVFIVLEPQWQLVAEQQAIARAVRINSHLGKDKEVHVYHLLSHSDKNGLANLDELMFENERKKYAEIVNYLEVIRQASIPMSETDIMRNVFSAKELKLMGVTEMKTILAKGVKGLHPKIEGKKKKEAMPRLKNAKPGKRAKPRSKSAKLRKPRSKSAKPRSKSAKPRSKSAKPRSKSAKPRSKSAKPRSKSAKPRSKSAKPRSKSEKPRSKSTKPRKRSKSAKPRKPRAAKQKPRSKSAKPRKPRAKLLKSETRDKYWKERWALPP